MGEIDMARWQGRVDASLQHTERRQDSFSQRLEQVANDLSLLRADVASVKSRVGVYAVIGAIAGTGATQLLVSSLRI